MKENNLIEEQFIIQLTKRNLLSKKIICIWNNFSEEAARF